MIPGCYSCATTGHYSQPTGTTTVYTGTNCSCNHIVMSFSSAPERDEPAFPLPILKPRPPHKRPEIRRLPPQKFWKSVAHKRACY